jgi:hypothetical protein
MARLKHSALTAGIVIAVNVVYQHVLEVSLGIKDADELVFV